MPLFGSRHVQSMIKHVKVCQQHVHCISVFR